ncbi:MAG: ATP-binding cassette domain-containing protein [Ilumatobacteraceae bacterium]
MPAAVPDAAPDRPAPVLHLDRVSVIRDGPAILGPLDWVVRPGERWLVLGANGSGKTTLLQVASLYLHPSNGQVRVLGELLGRTDVRTLRRRIGLASAALAAQLRPQLSCLDIVMTAKYAALEPWWHTYDDTDRAAARAALVRMGVEGFAERPLSGLSSGEQQRVFLARALMTDPELVLLDEPSARLDLGGRESLVAALDDLMTAPDSPPVVLVTHHVDEVPPSITHVLMLQAGEVVACGPVEEALTPEHLSTCFSLDLALERRANGRFSAYAR